MVISRIPKLCRRPLRFNQGRRASVSATSFRLIIVAAPISKFTVALVARARHNLPTFGHCRGDVGYWFLSAHSWMRRVCSLYNGMTVSIILGFILELCSIACSQARDYHKRFPIQAGYCIAGYSIISVDRWSALLIHHLYHEKSNSDV